MSNRWRWLSASVLVLALLSAGPANCGGCIATCQGGSGGGGHHHHHHHGHCEQNGGDVINNTCSGFGFS